MWVAFVGACLLGLVGILELERRNRESGTIINEQANAIATQQRVIQSLEDQVNSLSGLVHRPLKTLMKVPMFLLICSKKLDDFRSNCGSQRFHSRFCY